MVIFFILLIKFIFYINITETHILIVLQIIFLYIIEKLFNLLFLNLIFLTIPINLLFHLLLRNIQIILYLFYNIPIKNL